MRRQAAPAAKTVDCPCHEKIGAWTSNASTRSARCSPTCRTAPSSSGGIFDYDRKALRLNEVNAALEVTRGRRIEAAQKLGIGRNTITRKIQELGLDD